MPLSMTAIPRLHAMVFGLLATAAAASAQTPLVTASANMWAHGTTLNVFGGATGTPGDSGAVAGGAFGWELTPRFALEGTGSWLDWGRGAHGFAAAMTARTALLTPRPYVPFLAGGIGLYRASFDRFDATMPGFYRRRMMNGPGPGVTATFTDPTLVGGGGVDVFLSRHWTIRPEVMAAFVMRDSNHFVVTTGVVRLGYHFEDHPVTPRAGTGLTR